MWEQMLQEFSLFGLEREGQREGALIAACSCLLGGYRARDFAEGHSDRMRDNGQKLEHGKFKLYIEKVFFSP